MKKFLVFAVAANVAWMCTVAFVVGCLATSGIKSVNDDCGKTYGIESIGIQGDWFCPEK